MNNLPNPFEDEDVRAQFEALKDVEVRQPESIDPEPQDQQQDVVQELPDSPAPEQQPQPQQQDAEAVAVDVPDMPEMEQAQTKSEDPVTVEVPELDTEDQQPTTVDVPELDAEEQQSITVDVPELDTAEQPTVADAAQPVETENNPVSVEVPEMLDQEPAQQEAEKAEPVTVDVPSLNTVEGQKALLEGDKQQDVRALADRASDRLGSRIFTSDQAPEVFQAAANTSTDEIGETIIRLLEDLPQRIAQELTK